jgi:hypothetical protein
MRAPPTRLGSLAAPIAVVVAGAGLGGCAVGVDGSFGALPFQPGGTAVAILDEHDVLVREGVVVPVARGRRAKKIHVWLSSEQLDPTEDWNTLDAARLSELRTRLATSDLMLVQGIDYDALGDGDELVALDDSGRTSGDFSFALAHRALRAGDLPLVGAGLGARVTVTAHAERVDDGEPRGGSVRVTLDVQRERAAGQPAGNLVTGDVTLTLDLPFAPERLAESNLAVVAPIARCAADAGPFASAACADEPALPIADSSGVH